MNSILDECNTNIEFWQRRSDGVRCFLLVTAAEWLEDSSMKRVVRFWGVNLSEFAKMNFTLSSFTRVRGDGLMSCQRL